MVSQEFSRMAMLVGEAAVQQLHRVRVAVVGIGGVGTYVVEALARAGVGAFLLVDDDVIACSNINRQIIAMHSTLGQPKTKVMAQRICDIHPEAQVLTREMFCLPENIAEVLRGDWDYVVDAVDTVSAKLAIVEYCSQQGIPVISAMGTGNKLDPTQFLVADIFETSVCPLCRVMRRELKKRGIPKLKVVYSQEMPISPENIASDEVGVHAKRQIPGSISFVPAVAGLTLAGEVIKDLAGLKK